MDQFNSTVATSNFTTSPGLLPHPSWYSRGLVPAVMCSLCFLVGVPGNIAVIILRPNWEHVSSLTRSLLLNLAISDLLCLLTLPIWIYHLLYGWTFGLVACKLLAYVMYCTLYSSLLTVTGLSVQRYLVVVHRLGCHQVHKRLLLVLLWLVAFILSIPPLVFRQIKTNQQRTECQTQYSSDAQWVAVLMAEAVFGFVSVFIVTFSYILLKRTVNQAAFFNNPSTTRLVTSIIVSLFVLWAPYYSLNVMSVAAISLKNENVLEFYIKARRIAIAVTFVNSCLNPLLYAFTSHKFCHKKEPVQNQRMVQNPDMTAATEL